MLEIVSVVFTIVTGAVLAIFAVAAAYIQRARYVRDLYRRIDFPQGKTTAELGVFVRTFYSGQHTSETIRVTLVLYNDNPEPVLVRKSLADATANYLQYSGSTPDRRLKVAWGYEWIRKGSRWGSIVASGASHDVLLCVRNPDEPSLAGYATLQLELNAVLEVSAIPDSLSRILLPKSRGYFWVARPIRITLEITDRGSSGGGRPSIIGHNLYVATPN